MRNKKGPDRQRCKTPVFEFPIERRTAYKVTFWCLLWINDSIRLKRLPFIPLFFSLHRRPSPQTSSNAFDKSKKTP